MGLVPKLGAEINSKYDCRKLAHCGAPIQNPHGPIFGAIFGPHFGTRFWTTVLVQVLDQDFGAILEPNFHEN